MEQVNSFIIVYLVNKAYSHWYQQNKWYQPLPAMQNTLRDCWTSFIERKQIKRDPTTRYSDTVIKLRYFVGQLLGVDHWHILGTPPTNHHKSTSRTMNACSDLRCHRTDDKHCTQKPLGWARRTQTIICARVFLSMGSSIIPFNVRFDAREHILETMV